MTGILCLQFNPVIGDKVSNFKRVERYISDNSDKNVDLVLLPEFFSTGIDHKAFLNSPEDETGGNIIKKVQTLAKNFDVNIIAGSVIEKSQEKLYNTSFAVNRVGEIVAKYRKIHLFNYNGGTEGERITPGDELIIAEFDFGRVGMNICYDFRYPQMQRNLVKSGAEILVCPTAWCIPNSQYNNLSSLKHEQDVWTSLNKIRAYDNLVYVITCNQIGKVNDNISNIGCSMIVSPNGDVLSFAGNDECTIYSDIDIELVREIRKTYPISEID